MTMMIELPDRIAERLRHRAEIQHRSLEDVAVGMIEDSLATTEAGAEWDALIAQVRATPHVSSYVIEPTGTLEDLDSLLANERAMTPAELEQWQHEWRLVEAEIKAMEVADAISEGRR